MGMSYLPVLTIINSGGVNISVQIFTWTYVFNSPGYIPRRGYMNKNVLEKQNFNNLNSDITQMAINGKKKNG